ncbi:hypothetical protein TW95_gp0421 [Pandoravirus inopinatum]|uniref:Uncharacterized protein n=1 Tax=Pandoravirus inopinatum TaxID=1605721 RepID=A0A0B5J636_9VIRU|nr:hypothetical protein TW95_gp0421 [Pandoravirus inopinatum]AJF97155.1 hypothetical protein [Pandoravirus inopinatum]
MEKAHNGTVAVGGSDIQRRWVWHCALDRFGVVLGDIVLCFVGVVGGVVGDDALLAQKGDGVEVTAPCGFGQVGLAKHDAALGERSQSVDIVGGARPEGTATYPCGNFTCFGQSRTRGIVKAAMGRDAGSQVASSNRFNIASMTAAGRDVILHSQSVGQSAPAPRALLPRLACVVLVDATLLAKAPASAVR